MEKLYFKSKDNLQITGDFYQSKNPKDFILLCHRSHFNRGEYKDIAPKFNSMGYSCLAIDQRSGMNVLGFINETSSLAKSKKLPTGYLDAKQDIEAAIDYSYKKNSNKPIILLGSSYSASLALLIANETNKVKAVIAYSPGEYLKKINVSELIKNLDIPIYVTSARKEITDVTELVKNINPKYITQFKPEIEGQHAARVLWPTIDGNDIYWHSIIDFLKYLN